MPVMSYCAEEVLQRAVEIEKRARDFYKRAHDEADDGQSKACFAALSREEADHASTFAQMREALSREEREVQPYDPGNEMLHYLSGMEEAHAWEGQLGASSEQGAAHTLAERLQAAIRAEKETVLFYVFLKDFVPPDKGREAVEQVIREESRHAAVLKKRLDGLDAT